MSTDLEDRLSDHLRTRAEYDASGPAEIATVRQLAKRRSMRTRAALGVASLAAIAGLASFIPTGTDQSTLLTAEQPVDEQRAQDTDDGDDAEQLDPTPETPEFSEAAPPPSWRIIGDGAGGFTAVSVSTSSGVTHFVRSDDGLLWYPAGEWQHEPDTFVAEMRFVDGRFVALIDQRRPAGTGLSPDLFHPQVAVSWDLAEWEFIKLPLTNPDESSRFVFRDIAASGNDLMFWVIEYKDPTLGELAELMEQGTCGFSSTPTTASVTLCTGEVIDYAADDLSLNHQPAQRILLSEAGAPAIEQAQFGEDPASLEVSVSNGSLVFDEVHVELPADLAAQITWPADRPDDEPLPTLWNIANNDRGQQLLLLRNADDTLSTALLPEGTLTELSKDLVATSDFNARRVAYGPAGWAIAVDTGGNGYLDVVLQDWVVSGLPAFGYFTIESADGLERHSYQANTNRIPPYLQWSLFGEVRLFRPGTDELLVEITSQQTRDSYVEFTGRDVVLPDRDAFDLELVVDGWTLGGDPLRGPLILTSPDGVAQTFDDGFAFTNGDIADGVELDLPTATASLAYYNYRARPVQFFDDGELLVEFEMRAIHNALIEPLFADGELDGGPAFPSDRHNVSTWILYSPDGEQWQLVDDPILQRFRGPQLAVGDDELLLIQHGGAAPERFELPLADE